jgi:type IV secretion system protein VirB4
MTAALTVDRLKYGKQIKKEMGLGVHIPFLRHVDDQTVVLKSGFYASVIKLVGLPFQTMDQDEINSRLINRNTTLRALSSSRFALYGTIIRRRIEPRIDGDFHNVFAKDLNERYLASIANSTLFVNEMYLTVIRRPMRGKVGIIDSLLDKFRSVSSADESSSFILRDLSDTVSELVGNLKSYGAEVLKVEQRNGSTYSAPAEMFAKILSGCDPVDIPLPRMSLADIIGTRRLTFGTAMFEVAGKTPGEKKLGTMISIKEYPPMTGPGMLDGMLNLSHEMVITQSFSVEDRISTSDKIKTIGRQVRGSDDGETSAEDSVEQARDRLSAGDVIFGQHHLTVAVYGNTVDQMAKGVTAVTSELARMGMIPVRETLGGEPAFWAQLPGNFNYIARQGLIHSSNFAGFFSAHNFPSGKTTKLHWGLPVSLLTSTSKTAYNFSFHDEDVGNFTVVGPTGSGKTVVLNFFIAQSARIRPLPRVIFFDKDRGADIFIRAMGGRYETLMPGEASGFAPFQLEDTTDNRDFCRQLLAYMLRDGDNYQTPTEMMIISDAIDRMFDEMEPQERRVDVLHELLKGRTKAGMGDLSSRLTQWTSGDKAWLFNNPVDQIDLDAQLVGFDMTAVLDDPRTRTAALLYIFHRIRNVLDGHPTMIFLDEGWKLLDDPEFLVFIKDMMKTIRKQNGIIGFGTQSAADIVNSPIAATLVEQTRTNIFFPNPKADEDSYRRVFNLSAKEFEFVKNADKANRTFLVRHALDSVVVRLDLKDMPDLVKVLSGRTETVKECERLRRQHGDDPANWLPKFCGWSKE